MYLHVIGKALLNPADSSNSWLSCSLPVLNCMSLISLPSPEITQTTHWHPPARTKALLPCCYYKACLLHPVLVYSIPEYSPHMAPHGPEILSKSIFSSIWFLYWQDGSVVRTSPGSEKTFGYKVFKCRCQSFFFFFFFLILAPRNIGKLS